MKDKHLKLIASLMTVALCSLILLQYLFIKDLLLVKEGRFEQDVNEVLKAVTKKIEMLETASVVQRVQPECDFSSIFFDKEVGIFTQKCFMDSIISSETLITLTKPNSTFNRNIDRHFNQIYRVALEMTFNNKQLSERIDPVTLDSLLEVTLKDAGIRTPYEYCLLTSNGYVTFNAANSQLNIDLLNTNFRQKIYKEAVFTKPGELLLHFPKQESYIWSSSWLMLFSSLFFNGLVITTFGYTLFAIIRQKKLSAMKTDFINNMTHELKTPISTIKLASEMLLDKGLPKTEKRISRYANIISDENSRLQSHVEKVLYYARLEKNTLKLNMETLDIHELIEDAIQKSSLQIDKKRGKVCMDLAASNSLVQGDRLHLTNVIYNLLDNAIKYSKEIPEIAVFTRNTNNGLSVAIKDNGIGISKETLKRIFDKFYRVSTGNIHDVKGFGLGLSYVKLMVEAHGGSIFAQSKLNKGSTFEFHISTLQKL